MYSFESSTHYGVIRMITERAIVLERTELLFATDDERFPTHITSHKLTGVFRAVLPSSIICRCMFMKRSSNVLFITFLNKMEPS